jgi:hypothetical protein
MKDWHDSRSLRELYLKEVIHPLLPNARYKFTIQNGDFNKTNDSFYGALSSDEIFKNSYYEYQGDGRFLHFTSLVSLDAIIRSGYIRMSDFTNLMDKSELNYASAIFKNTNKFTLFDDNIENEKKKLFCLSVCQHNIETIKNTYMWNDYGNKGSGVIIDFSLNCLKSNRFSIGHIKYGNKELRVIEDLKNRLIKFSEENKFNPNNAVEMITILLSFHKALKYKSEQELRILFTDKELEFMKLKYPTIESTINNKNKVISYNKIFLKGRVPFKESNPSLFPEIKINRVILGYNLSYDEKESAISHFNSLRTLYEELDFQIYHLNDDLELIKLNYYL